ncbi:MAG: D-alanyl-lipoteichoic acid biosynthesis protein DltD, partial [Crocinitomicaceae bacterium]
MLKKIIFLHVIPIFIAFTIVFLTYPLIKNYFNAKVITETVHGNQTKLRGWYDNLNGSTDAELQYIASIKNKNQLTLFGSSEFSDSSTVPFNFFPDSLGQQSIGLGHAYHQELSILIELLAAHKYNIESKICIFLSPGWFSSEGTNIQSFIEFARPNFLKNIINNDSISLKYKKHIGQFIDKYSGDIENMDQVMENFVFISKTDSMNYFKQFLRNYFGTIKTTNNVDYLIYQNKIKTHTWDGDFNITGHNLQNQFINSITTNKM